MYRDCSAAGFICCMSSGSFASLIKCGRVLPGCWFMQFELFWQYGRYDFLLMLQRAPLHWRSSALNGSILTKNILPHYHILSHISDLLVVQAASSLASPCVSHTFFFSLVFSLVFCFDKLDLTAKHTCSVHERTSLPN